MFLNVAPLFPSPAAAFADELGELSWEVSPRPTDALALPLAWLTRSS